MNLDQLIKRLQAIKAAQETETIDVVGLVDISTEECSEYENYTIISATHNIGNEEYVGLWLKKK